MLESRLETSFNCQCRKRGDGRPDRMVLHDGAIYLVELKQLTGQRSPLQRAWHDRAERLTSVVVYTLYGPEEVRNWIDEHLGELA